MNHLPKSFEALIDHLSRLPGIGKKSALRLAIYIAEHKEDLVQEFADTLLKIQTDLKFCRVCGNYSDHELCNICSNPSRRNGIICVVESVKDLLAIEETSQFNGRYHILGGLISPIDGVGPEDLRIEELLHRIDEEEITELIMAISSTIEGDTTLYYLSRQVGDEIRVSSIARGVSFGGELEYADEFTLGRAILRRLPVDQIFNGEQ